MFPASTHHDRSGQLKGRIQFDGVTLLGDGPEFLRIEADGYAPDDWYPSQIGRTIGDYDNRPNPVVFGLPPRAGAVP